MIHPHVFTFPVLLMEDVITMLGTAIRWFETYFKINLVRITGTYVRARCLISASWICRYIFFVDSIECV